MHILYIHQYFNFPSNSGGTRSYDLAKSFVDKGFRVTILTTDRDTMTKKKKWHKVETEGLVIHYLSCPYDNGMGFLSRIKSFLYFAYFSSYKACKIKADLILATSTPLTVAIPALIKKLFDRTPFIFEIRDVWPEVPIRMSIINNPIIINLLYKFEKIIYRKASHLIPLSVGMAKNICGRIKGLDNKITIIPNIAEINRFNHDNFQEFSFPFDLQNKKIVLYCGTFGNVNGLSYAVNLAKLTLKIDDSIMYCFCGKGKELDQILELAKQEDVLNKNFFYLGTVSKSKLPTLYRRATVGSSFVIDNPILWDNSANKFFDTMAAHRPIVINHKGWQAEVIEKYKCGYVLPPKIDVKEATRFVEFMNDFTKIELYGENAFKLAQSEFSLNVATKKYLGVIKKVLPLNPESNT